MITFLAVIIVILAGLCWMGRHPEQAGEIFSVAIMGFLAAITVAGCAYVGIQLLNYVVALGFTMASLIWVPVILLLVAIVVFNSTRSHGHR